MVYASFGYRIPVRIDHHAYNMPSLRQEQIPARLRMHASRCEHERRDDA